MNRIITAKNREIFLTHLAESGNITAAAKLSGMTRQWAYLQRAQDPDFAQRWDDALYAAADVLEQEARRRAMEGWLEPVVSGGKWIRDDEGKPAYMRKYSDRLLEVLLRGSLPRKYNQRALTVSGQVEHRIIPSQNAVNFASQMLSELGDNPEARDAVARVFARMAKQQTTVESLPPAE